MRIIENCPICQNKSSKNTLAYEGMDKYNNVNIRMLQCVRCNVYYHETYFDNNEIKDYYKTYFQIMDKELGDEIISKNFKTSFNCYEGILDKIKNKSKILEIGCGAGGAVSYLKDKKECDCDLIESETIFVDELKKNGYNIYSSILEELEFPDNTYDYVISSNVLEHFLDPILCLNKIFKMLKPGGQMIMITPGCPDGFLTINQYINNRSFFKLFNFQACHFLILNELSASVLLKKTFKKSKIEYLKKQKYRILFNLIGYKD